MDIKKIKKRQRLEEKSMYIIEYVYRVLIASKYIKLLAYLNIHPIAVTLINTILFPIILYVIYNKHFLIGAILIQVYAIIDHTDGMLARYTNKQTYIGSRLDRLNDNIFFNFIFIMIAISYNIPLFLAFMVIVCMNIHNIFGMFYFPKKMKKLKKIERFGIKKWLLERNILLGMDCSMMLTLTSLFLIINMPKLLFYIISFLYLYDLIYRIIELKINEKLEKRNDINE